jgi:hypothetical protein
MELQQLREPLAHVIAIFDNENGSAFHNGVDTRHV